MAAAHYGASSSKGQGPVAGEMSFTLDGGYTSVIGMEERRVYDQIIKINVGAIATAAGLGGEY